MPPSVDLRPAGQLIVVTHVTAVAGWLMLYVWGPGAQLRSVAANYAYGGTVVVLVGALAAVGGAAWFYPYLSRQEPGLALFYVMARALEAACLLVGVAVVLPAVANLRPAMVQLLPFSVSEALELVSTSAFVLGRGVIWPIGAVALVRLLALERQVSSRLPGIAYPGIALVLVPSVAFLLRGYSAGPGWAVPLWVLYLTIVELWFAVVLIRRKLPKPSVV